MYSQRGQYQNESPSVYGSRCPTNQLSEIVAVGYETERLKVVSAKVVDSSEYGKERRLVTHIMGVLVSDDDARVGRDAGRINIGPDLRRSYKVFRKNSRILVYMTHDDLGSSNRPCMPSCRTIFGVWSLLLSGCSQTTQATNDRSSAL